MAVLLCALAVFVVTQSLPAGGGQTSSMLWLRYALICIGVWSIAVMIPGLRKVALFPLLLVSSPLTTLGLRIGTVGRCERIDRLPAGVTAENAEQLAAYRAGLEREGFCSGGMLIVSEFSWSSPQRPSGRVLIEPFEHTTRRHSANVILALLEAGPVKVHPSLNFHERLRSGEEIVITNGGSPSLFPRAGGVHGLQLPGVRDVAELYRLQRAMLQRFAPAYSPPPPAPEGWETAVLMNDRRAVERWIADGWLVPAAPDGRYRIPFWRALVTALRLTPPISDLRVWLNTRKSRQMRQEMGA